jgi:prolyl-tRNA synthetase
LWLKTGRDKDLGETMVRFTDRRGRKVCLGPTHEEIITDLVAQHLSSHKQLPLLLYQIQTKFRDELRPRFGLIRACEFIMKDAYSFDKDEQGLELNYKAMLGAYNKIFARCGLEVVTVEADPGVMGGKVSHEFMVPAKDGEDVVQVRGEKVNCIEVGHIFKLGTKYSLSLGAQFQDAGGRLSPVIMGCYGIGVSRLISAVIEQHNDESGIIWPKEVAPFKALVIALDPESAIRETASAIYNELSSRGVEVLFDDRDERAGVKFKDADLIGIPVQIIVGRKSAAEGKVELRSRSDKTTLLLSKEEAVSRACSLAA